MRASSLIRPFYPALNGLRAVAFLLVFTVHYGLLLSRSPFLAWGWVGVDIFFVLSGFLITGILYDSLHREHFFRDFYLRRALRIFPLFYGIWITLLILTPVLHVAWNRYILSTVFYLENFFLVSFGPVSHANPGLVSFPSLRHNGDTILVFEHFWSLCVEEQFYLAWPAVVWFVRSRQTLLRICIAVAIIVPFLRWFFVTRHPGLAGTASVYMMTPFRVDTLLIGGALALWLRGTQATLVRVRRVARITLVAAPALLAVLYSSEHAHSRGTDTDYVVATIGLSLIAVASASMLLLALDPSTLWYRALQIPPFPHLGRISYGLYVFHAIPMVFLANKLDIFRQHHIPWMMPVVALIFTYVCAWLSFRYLESPFLRLKDRLTPRRPTVSVPAPAEAAE